jgi:hypothetical protein
MAELSFVSDPLFDYPDGNASNATFVKATHTVGGRDAMEEYVACGLFPLSASFKLGEVVDEETPTSKLSAALMDFPIVRLSGEINDCFWARVELANMDVVGQYTRGEHKACVKAVPNQGRVNQVFKHGGVPYGPCLAPGSETSEEATKKGKQDASTISQSKCAKVLGR